MSRRLIPIPNLTGGVSQQPAATRAPGRLEDCENMLLDPVQGLRRRSPTQHVKVLQTLTAGVDEFLVPGEDLWHLIDRGAGERYVCRIGPKTVQVWDLDGNVFGVYDQDGNALSPGDTDFAYLNLVAPNVLGETEYVLEQGGGSPTTWLKWSSGTLETTTEHPPVPGLDAAILRAPNGVSYGGVYLNESNGGIGYFVPGRMEWSTYVRMPNSNQPDVVGLQLANTTAGVNYRAWFAVDASGVWTVQSTAENAVASVEHIDGDYDKNDTPWYRIKIVVDVPPDEEGDAFEARIRVGYTSASIQDVLICAPRLTKGGEDNKRFYRPSSYVSALTLADYTLVANRNITVAKDTTTSPEQPADHFVFVKQGAYESDYGITVSMPGESDATFTLETWDGNSTNDVTNRWDIVITTGAVGWWSVEFLGVSYQYNSATTDRLIIADNLRSLINVHPALTAVREGVRVIVTGDLAGMPINGASFSYPGAGSATLTEIREETTQQSDTIKTTDLAVLLKGGLDTAMLGWANPPTLTVVGSTIKFDSAASYPITAVEATDSSAGSLIAAFHDEVPSMADLPVFCEHNHVVKVVGEQTGDDTLDDYFVKFVAEAGSDFGVGYWVETISPDLETSWDADTMPHQLVSKVDDGTGPIGDSGAIYFEWGPISWTDRDAGDDNTNPFPGIVGRKVSSLFFHKGRFGIAAGQSVCLSEVNLYFQLFRSTVRTLVDSDPIDMRVDHPRVSIINNTAPVGRDLMLFTDKSQFVLTGEPILSPATAAARSVTEHDCSPYVPPLSVGAGAMFVYPNSDYVGVREVIPTGEEFSYTDNDITIAVPRLLNSRPLLFDVSRTADTLVYVSQDTPWNMQVFRFTTDGGERVQSAWSNWSVGSDASDKIIGLFVVESMLYLITRRMNEVCLEKLDLSPALWDEGVGYITHIDRRIDQGQFVSISYTGGYTTITLPYLINTNDVYAVTKAGDILEIDGYYPGGSEITVVGDYSTTKMWVGMRYTSEVTLSKPYVQQQTRNGTLKALDGRTIVQELLLQLYRTMRFTAFVERSGWPNARKYYDESIPTTEEFSVICQCENDKLDVVLQATSPWPMTFASAAWIVNHVRPS